jgi:hypothetical protein
MISDDFRLVDIFQAKTMFVFFSEKDETFLNLLRFSRHVGLLQASHR